MLKSKTIKQISFLLFFITQGIFLFAQQKKVVILNSETKERIPFAHVCFESLTNDDISYEVSDGNGIVHTNLQGTFQVAVSCIGFNTQYDTINLHDDLTIALIPSSTQLEELVVTGQFKPQRADKSIYKVNVLHSGLIESKAATNLEELLSSELGMNLTRDPALGTSLRMQGLDGEHVKILVDGVPVIGRQNGIVDLSQINLYNVDHVEVVEGPMSVVYGSNALAGAINIITKEHTREKFNTSVKTYYESVGVYDVNANTSFRAKNHNFSFTGGRYFFGGFTDYPTTRWNEFKPKLQYSASGQYRYVRNNLKIRANGNYFEEELRDRGPLEEEFDFEKAFDRHHYTRRAEGKAGFTYNMPNDWQTDVVGALSSYQKLKNSYLNNLVTLEKNIIPEASAHDTTKFSAQYSRGTLSGPMHENIDFQAGYEINKEQATGKRLSGIKHMGDYALFSSFQFEPHEQISFQPGLRYIYNTRYNAPLQYSLNLKSAVNDRLQVRASVSNGFRAPSLKELYLEFNDINHNITGNQNLKAERGQNMNLWIDYSLSNRKSTFETEFNLYHKKIKNAIELLFDPVSETTAQYFNLPTENYKTKGVTSKISYKYHPRFTLQAGFDLNGRSKIDNESEFIWSTDYNAGFHYKNIRYLFEISTFYKYIDRYVRYAGEIDYETFELNNVSERYIDGYHNMDITLSRPFFKRTLTFSTGIKNLFDNTSVSSTGGGGVHSGGGSGSAAINWGRTWFIKLNYQFSSY